MAVLTKEKIIAALKNKKIKIAPLDESQIGPGSVDLTLGNEFRIFKRHHEVYHIKDESDFSDITEEVSVADGKYIVINPGEMILGITKEKISLSTDLCG